MMRKHIAALVVTDGGEPVGLISERDLVSAAVEKGSCMENTIIREIVSRPVLTVSPDESLKRAMALMTSKRVRHLPVFAERELVGIVSLGDLIKYRLEEMELESNVLRDLAIAVR
jgi:CBS domain-containing protein